MNNVVTKHFRNYVFTLKVNFLENKIRFIFVGTVFGNLLKKIPPAGVDVFFMKFLPI